MLMIRTADAAAGLGSAPPAVCKPRNNDQGDEKCEPATWGIEKPFRAVFPTRYRQAEQSENGPTTHTDYREPKG